MSSSPISGPLAGAAEPFLRAALQGAELVFIATDPDGTIRLFNDAASQMLGYLPEDLVGREKADVLFDAQEIARRAEALSRATCDRIEPAFEALAAPAESGGPDEREWTCVRKDGSRFGARVSVAAVRSEDGAISGFLLIGRSLGISPEAAREDRFNKERFLHAMAGANDGLWDWDISSETVCFSERFRELLGYSREEFPDELEAAREILHRDDKREVYSAMTAHLEEDRPLDVECRLRCAAGDYRWFRSRGRAVRNLAGQPTRMSGSITCVNDRKRAESALLEQQTFARQVIDASPSLISVRDTQGNFLLVNRALAAFFDREPGDVVNRNLADVLENPGEVRATSKVDQEVLATHETIRFVGCWTRPNGEQLWLDTVKAPLVRTDGSVDILTVSTDITDRKRAELDLVRAKEQAEAANQAKSDFLANMSHELRTPLNSVIGFANILSRNKAGNLTTKDLGYLERIHTNGTHLLGLINQVLDLAKVEAGRIELEQEQVRLDDLARETIAQLESGVGDRDVTLSAEVPEGLRPVIGDGNKLRQVLINLVGNALKFTEKGSVVVRIETDGPEGLPKALEVSDTGIGIPLARQQSVFEAFQQADNSTSRQYGGTGLGLAISRTLLEKMGFALTLDSEVGRGSTFRIDFAPHGIAPEQNRPAHTAEAGVDANAATSTVGANPEGAPAAGGAESGGADGKDGSGALVLVIDDEWDSRTLLGQHFEDLGCRVIPAASGEEGLQIARQQRPDLITLDLMMPTMDGWEVLRRLKEDPVVRDIPTVVISIVAGENRYALAKANAVLDKPVTRQGLTSVLRKGISGRRSRVLIVDDDADSRRILTSYLEETDVEISTATNGVDALRVMEEGIPDLIILDLMMPVMDGRAFLREIRKNPDHENLPVVVVTAKDLGREEMTGLHLETRAVLRKGEALDSQLRLAMEHVLRRRQERTPCAT